MMGPMAGPGPGAGAGMPGPGAPSGGGGNEMEMLIALATQILGRPPQSEEELMQVLQLLAQGGQGGPAPGGLPEGPVPGGPAPENAAMMAAMGGQGGYGR